MHTNNALPRIGLDLGDTVFDRTKPRIMLDGNRLTQLCEGSFEAITSLSEKGYPLYVVSKIDENTETRVMLSLRYAELMPDILDPENIQFCFSREAKGPILREHEIDIHVDDRIEVLNAAHKAGVPCKILFIAVRDDRESLYAPKKNFEELHIAVTWQDVLHIITHFTLQPRSLRP
jgi:hypothetical protein